MIRQARSLRRPRDHAFQLHPWGRASQAVLSLLTNSAASKDTKRCPFPPAKSCQCLMLRNLNIMLDATCFKELLPFSMIKQELKSDFAVESNTLIVLLEQFINFV